MNAKLRRNLPGPFEAQDLGRGSWRLSRGAAAPCEVFLRGAEPGAAAIFQAPAVDAIDIDWDAQKVALTVTSAQRRAVITARSAILHEPLTQLYACLPLADFDEKSRRFWRRVFRVVRIPGGRHLLGALARRNRK
jgi:hypothetical protein